MREEILVRAEEYLARRQHRMRMLRAFTAMALVVAIMTSYVLMLPGLTMQAEAYCGYEEHTHDESCYTLELICGEEEREPSETVVKLLQCAFEPHVHSEACRADNGSIGCGVSTSYWHSHSAECYDESGALVCQLVSNPKHEHDDACYETLAELTCAAEESAGHVHDASCYGIVKDAGAVCGLEESAGHVHTDACSVTTSVLSCGISEATMTDLEPHTHNDGCYTVETAVVCGTAEGEGAHTHTDACYPVSQEPTCGLENGEGGHTHGEACYTYALGELSCDLLHAHGSSCYDPESGLVICGKVAVPEHNHTTYCLRNVTAVEEGHAHGDTCYQKNYSCALTEHRHVTACFDAPDASAGTGRFESVSTIIMPTVEPTAEPTVEVTVEPTAEPTVEVTVEPTAEPTVEVTVEPTAEPTVEVTVEPTAEPTVEVTAEPTAEPTVEVTVEPTAEPTVEITAEPTAEPTVEVTVEPTAEPTVEITAEPTAEPTVEVTAEPTAEPTVEVTAEPTAEPVVTAEPTESLEPAATPGASLGTTTNMQYSCGLSAHMHSDACRDEAGELICGYESEHEHTLDCKSGCGLPEHYHVDGCYNEAGEAVCGIEVHRHDPSCMIMASDRETAEDITAGKANFYDYIAESKWNTKDGVDISEGSDVVYNPDTDSFETKLQISFAIPNYVLRGYSYWNGWYWVRVPGQQEFYYELPEEIKLTDNMIDKPFPITSPDGLTIEGTFYIRQTDDGKYYLEIEFSDEYVRTASAGYSMPGWPVNQTPYSQGNISFGCVIGSEAAQEDGSIRIEFTTEDVLDIPAKDITYPDNETATANIATEKSGSYIREGNKLYYTVLVHSDKGTPSHVKLDDTLNFDGITVKSFSTPVVKSYTSTWNGSSWVSDGNTTTLSTVKGGPAELTSTTATYNQHQGAEGEIKLDMHLPQITDPGDNKRFTYEITYEINLEDVGLEFSGNGTNTVTAKSETSEDNKVEASASSNVGIYVDSLSKVGSYNQQTDKIKWSITVNGSYQDIAGAVLTDEMFTTITEADAPSNIVVKDASGNVLSDGNGYQINYANGKVSSIEFFGTATENGVEVNRNKYIIEYYTTPTQTSSEYTETNDVRLETDEDFTEETGGAYVKRDLRIYKQNTGATMDGTDRIIDWKSGFTVYDSGLNEDLVITDTISGDNHYMTVAQLTALYNNIQGQNWFATGADKTMTVTYTDADGNEQTASAADMVANPGNYADCKIIGFTYTIYKDKLPTDYNGQTIEITYQTTADTAGLNGTATYYNGWGVGESDTGANHTYTYTEIIKVDKLNYWDGNDELSLTTTTGVVEWHVNVTMDKQYETLTITDTLPAATKLNQLKIGPYGDTIVELENPDYDETSSTPINLVVNSYGYHEQALLISGTYTPSTGVIVLNVSRNPNTYDASLDGGFGSGETFKVKVFAQLKDEYFADLGEGQQLTVGRITNDVHVSTNEGDYGDDEHSYNITAQGTAKVTKTDGSGNGNDTTVNTQTGELTWRVNVTQDDTYDYLEIVDTLPEGVELVNVKLGRYTGTEATYDAATADANGDCALTFTLGGNDTGLKYSGTYNINTRVVTIKVEPDGSGTTSEVFGSGKTYQLIYNCKVEDDLMPDTENGEYKVDLGKLTNSVNVTTEEGTYGSDSQSQTVTVEKEKPVTDTVGKNHSWTASMNLLEYSVDLNPTAADLDPSKNMLTVTDKLTYINAPNSYDRELTLIKSSVKLYYADYDANGNPITDANGRLVKGVEVPYSDWTMSYSSTLYENDWQQSDCTMVLTVPDERALILEYDYRVSMKYVPGWDNKLFISNTVSITGYEEESHSSSENDKWEEYNAGGIVSTERSFSVVKFDASNHAKLIEGAVFTVYEYSSETDTWTALANYVTDGNGNLMVQWQQSDEDVQYKENVAYKIVETQPALGYVLEPNPTPYYFYWANANVTTSSLPDNWASEYSPRELVTNPGHVEVDNLRKTTSVSVNKIWDVEDESLIPDSLTVHLKRYAIPADVWEAHPEYNHGLSSDMVSVVGDLKSSNSSNAIPSFSIMCYAGSTVSFDLLINKDWTTENWGQAEPVFNNLPEGTTVTRTVSGVDVVYHYEMVVNESVNLDGYFEYVAGGYWGNDWTWDVPEFTNITITANTGEGGLDDSGISAELDQYRDRNYTNTMTLTQAGNWEGLWENLDLVGTDANGNEVHYKYYIIEDTPSGFAGTITGGSSDISGDFEIKNKYDESRTELTAVKVVKIWQDADGNVIDPLLDSVEVRLYQKDELTGKEIVYPYNGFATTVINAATDWSFYFRDLPYGTWDKDGNVTMLYSYRIEEVTKDPSFVTQIVAVNAAGAEVLDENFNGATVTVINAERHKVSATVYKEWEDGADLHSSDKITVELTRQILTQDGYVDDTTFTAVTQELSASNNWEYTWTELDDASETGDAYRYVVKETHVNGTPVADCGYIPVYSTNDGSIPNDGSMTITNELPAEMTITKEWLDSEGNPIDAPAGASVTLELWRTTKNQLVPLLISRAFDPTVDAGTDVEELVATFTLNEDNGWQKVYTNLPAESLGGEAYYYYVKEIAIEGYTTEYEGNYTSNEGEIIVKNKRDDTELTYIKINKLWTDRNGTAITPDGYSAVYFKLYENSTDITGNLNAEINGITPVDGYIEVTAATNWSITVNGLTEGATYKIVEYLKNGDHYTEILAASYAPQEGPTGTSFNATNRLTEITVEKVWEDVYGNTLSVPNDKEVVLELYCRKYNSTEAIYLFDVTLPIEQEDGTYLWSRTVEDLTAGPVDAPVTYFFKEKVPAGFDVSYTHTADGGVTKSLAENEGVNNGTITVTNTQQDVSFSLKKVWQDKSGNEMDAPTGVYIAFHLMRVGTGTDPETGNAVDEIVQTIYLPDADGNWEGDFTELPKTDLNGNAYQYYITEGSSNGMTDYTVTYSPPNSSNPKQTDILTDEAEVTVTNQLQQKNIKINVMKRWTKGSTAKDVTINVYRYILTSDGQKVVDPTYSNKLTFKADDTAAYQTVTDLPDYGEFQKDGTTYTGDFYYFVEEQNITEDYTVTYSNDDGTTTVVNPQDASLHKDGNLRVINHERAKLKVFKNWNLTNASMTDSISFDLYRKEIPASAIEDGEGETEFVDVTFRIVVMNSYTGSDGQTVTEEALLSSVTKTFRKGAQVMWKPTWTTDWTWHPISSSQPQSVVYKTQSGTSTPIVFDTSADNDTSSPYEYTFDAGYMVENGTVTWTTDNWYQNGGADNGSWSHSFTVDGIAEASTYDLRAASRAVGDVAKVGSGSFTLNAGTAATQTATMTIGDKTYTYEIQDGDWSMLFYDLPVWSEDGESAYVYYVEEPTDEYLVSYTNNGGIQSGEITITNSDKETEIAEVTVTKAYADGSPTTPAVEVELYRSVTDGSKTYIERVGTATLSADNDWSYKWSDLLRGGTITQEGMPITGDYTYFVQEVVPTGFTATYSTTDGVVGFTDNGELLQGTVTITNTPKTGLTVKKVWDSSADPADEIEFALKRSETAIGDESGKEKVSITFQMVIDYTWTEEATGIVYPDRMVLATHTEEFIKGATVDWKPIWTNVNDDWHPTTGVVTYNGNPIPFNQPVNNVDEYHYTFHLGQVNESGTVVWAMDNWFWHDPDWGFYWEHTFNKNAGNTLSTHKLNAGNNWQMTFYDLPTLSADTLYKYGYEVEELTEGYGVHYTYNTTTNETTGEMEGTITITNSEKPPETTFVTAQKKYVTTESNPPEVTVRLYRRITELQADGDGNQVEVTLEELVPDSEQKLNASNNWEYTWNELLCYGEITKDGQTVSGKYSFRIEEDVPEGYEVSYSREEGKVPNAGTVVITNQEVTEVGVEKVWVNQDASTAPEVEFNLIQKATPIDGILNDPSYPTVDVKLQVTNAGPDEWQAEFHSQHMTVKKEANITWNLQYETSWGYPGVPAEGSSTYTDPGYILTPDGDTYPVSISQTWWNNKNYATFSVTFPASSEGTYFWVTGGWYPDNNVNGASDANAYWSSTTSATDPSLGEKTKVYGTYTLSTANSWKEIIGSLPTKDSDGIYTYTYYVEETAVDGYAVQYSNNGGIVGGDITITNTRPLIQVSVVKQYAEGSSTTPAVDVELVRSITQNGTTLEEVVDTQNLSDSNSWRYTWGNLQQSGSITVDGVTVAGEYQYYVREKVPLGFSVSYSPNEDGSVAANGTVTITNTEQSQLKVEKVWGEGAEEQEIQFKLWRRRVENTNFVACPNCGVDVAYAEAHAARCGNSGHYTCDELTHTTCTYCYNGYVCEDGHGDGVCTTPTCSNCGEEVTSSTAHVASCGTSGHYTCQTGVDHSAADCGTSGHYKCDSTDHGKQACGNHYKCAGDSLNHSWCSLCNQWSCNGSNHGNGVCNGGSTTEIKCPQCSSTVSSVNEHAAACGTSGHYWCDYKGHDAAGCGTSGHYQCDDLDHGNYPTDCYRSDHYKCDGKTHTNCTYCNNGKACDGEHGDGICNVTRCATCGEEVDSADQHKEACGHFNCKDYTAADHATCSVCGKYLCNGKTHGSGSCDVVPDGLTIDFVVKNTYNNNTDEFTYTLEGVPEGATVTWKVYVTDYSNKGWGPAWNPQFTYAGGTYTANPVYDNTAGYCEYTATFTATASEKITLVIGSNWQAATVTQSAEYVEAASLSLSSTTRTSRPLTTTSRASEVVDTTGATDMGTYVLNEGNSWEHIFYELPQYSTDGKYVYEYFVQEITEGYDVSYTNNEGVVEGTITITNDKHVPTTTDVKVNKTWLDESGNAYMLTAETPRYFKLFNGTEDITSSATNIEGATLAGEYILLTTPLLKNEASFVVKNLPIGGAYSVKEYILVDGTYREVTDYKSVTNGYVIDVTNRLTDITVNKTWAADSAGNSSYSKPTVIFELWRTYEGGTDELVGTKEMKTGVTSLTWDMLSLTADGTTPYKYYVKEQQPSGFVADNDGSVDVAQGAAGTITNTPTEMKVEKEWTMLDGTAITPTDDTVIYYKVMRQKVTVSDGTETKVDEAEAYSTTVFDLTSAEDWKATHTILPLYWKDTTNNTSGEYRYYVVETDQNGNEVYASYSSTSVDVSTTQTITITNTETAITVKKIWSINGGSLPETLPAITLQLRYTYTQGVMATEDPVAEEITLTADTAGVTVTSDAAGNVFWTYTWDKLATHDLVDGEAKARYYYVLEADEPENFRHVDGDMNNIGITGAVNGQIIEITNELITYELPETGGAGTTPYTVCGMLAILSAAAALMYIELQRKKQWGEGHES